MSFIKENITTAYLNNQSEKIKNIIFGNLLVNFNKNLDLKLIEKISKELFEDLELFIKKNHNPEAKEYDSFT